LLHTTTPTTNGHGGDSQCKSGGSRRGGAGGNGSSANTSHVPDNDNPAADDSWIFNASGGGDGCDGGDLIAGVEVKGKSLASASQTATIKSRQEEGVQPSPTSKDGSKSGAQSSTEGQNKPKKKKEEKQANKTKRSANKSQGGELLGKSPGSIG